MAEITVRDIQVMAENVRNIQVYDDDDIDIEDKSDAESDDLHMNKRMRRLAYITALALLQTAVVLVFCLTIMNIRHPKFRIGAINVEKLVISDDNNTAPSLDMKFHAEVSVKNTNFGHYEFDESSISFAYGGAEAGKASIEKEKVRARGTKTMSATAEVEIKANSGLKNDVKLGFLTLASQGKLSGKVHLMKVIKLKRAAEMNCTIVINLANRLVHDLKCK